MIRLIEALNFRCLRYVHQPLGPFHVLVGPNASGKTTFLDVVGFLGQLVSDGVAKAIGDRTANLQDLVWNRREEPFELAIEAAIPEDRRSLLRGNGLDTIRYEVKIGVDRQTGEPGILEERVLLKEWKDTPTPQFEFFPRVVSPLASTLVTARTRRPSRPVITKTHAGNDNFSSEVTEKHGRGWLLSTRLGPRKSALANLPDDESKFPVSTWLRRFLAEGVQPFVLNSLLIRRPSPPGQGRRFRPDGSNLPWVVCELEKPNGKSRLNSWITHLQTALPDIEGIRTVEREEDKHRYLMIRYRGGLEVPSWMASDGTLRLLALTIPAYLPEFRGVYLIEEPENGVHPRAVEAMCQSLCSVYDAQILVATHSPVILSAVDVDKVLCFKKTEEGATDIVSGKDHPALRDWRGETNLGVLFAGGVLG